MWSDSEDLTVLADMYQIRIKIITTKGETDENPTVNWIYPDKSLEKDAEIKDVDIEDMVLLHSNDVHFDLIVPKESKLAKLGSLSFKHNIGPLLDIETYDEAIVEDSVAVDDEEEIVDISKLQKELNHHHHHHHFICKINKLHKEYTRYYVK